MDLESSDYRWAWPESLRGTDVERRKGMVGDGLEMRRPNPEWPWNYADAICEAYDSGRWDYVLISMHQEVIEELLLDRNVSVTRVYPSYSDREAYLERYRRRGNAEPFVELMGRLSETAVTAAEQHIGDAGGLECGPAIILRPGEFLEDGLIGPGRVPSNGGTPAVRYDAGGKGMIREGGTDMRDKATVAGGIWQGGGASPDDRIADAVRRGCRPAAYDDGNPVPDGYVARCPIQLHIDMGQPVTIPIQRGDQVRIARDAVSIHSDADVRTVTVRTACVAFVVCETESEEGLW